MSTKLKLYNIGIAMTVAVAKAGEGPATVFNCAAVSWK